MSTPRRKGPKRWTVMGWIQPTRHDDAGYIHADTKVHPPVPFVYFSRRGNSAGMMARVRVRVTVETVNTPMEARNG